VEIDNRGQWLTQVHLEISSKVMFMCACVFVVCLCVYVKAVFAQCLCNFKSKCYILFTDVSSLSEHDKKLVLRRLEKEGNVVFCRYRCKICVFCYAWLQ